MPTISWFYGISIRMFFNDHAPPHFHAVHDNAEATVAIETGEVLKGRLPPTARRLVREWSMRYHKELTENWDAARSGSRLPMQRIPGLDADDE